VCKSFVFHTCPAHIIVLDLIIRNRGIAPLILHLGTRWTWVVWENGPRYPLNRRAKPQVTYKEHEFWRYEFYDVCPTNLDVSKRVRWTDRGPERVLGFNYVFSRNCSWQSSTSHSGMLPLLSLLLSDNLSKLLWCTQVVCMRTVR